MNTFPAPTARSVPAWLVALLILSGCGSSTKAFDEEKCGLANYATTLPEGPAVFVNNACTSTSPDGSLEKPFATISEALESGLSLVAVAQGTYEENLTIGSNTHLVGAGADRTTIAPAGGETAILVEAASHVTLEGLGVQGSSHTGIRIQDSSDVALLALSSNGHNTAQECGGYGIFVVGSQDVDIKSCSVEWNDSVGIAVHSSTARMQACKVNNNGLGPESSGIAIVHGSAVEIGGLVDFQDGDDFVPACQVHSNTGAGIYVEASTATIIGNSVELNEHGGIALADCPGGSEISLVQDNNVKSNVSFGISVFGGAAQITENDVQLVTNCTGETQCFGHCVAVQAGKSPAAEVSITGNTVEGCESAGILVHGDSEVTITSNIVAGAELGGIWIQDGANALDVSGNLMQGNSLAGLMLVSNASADVHNNQVDTTGWGQHYDFYVTGEMVDMADGIVLSRLHTSNGITLADNQVLSSARAGIIFDDIAASQVTVGDGNTVAGNGEAGVALQGGAQDVLDAKALADKIEFTAEGAGPNGGAGDIVEGSTFSLASFMEPSTVGLCTPPDCQN